MRWHQVTAPWPLCKMSKTHPPAFGKFIKFLPGIESYIVSIRNAPVSLIHGIGWGYYSQIFKLQNANIPVLNSWMKAVCFLKLTLRFSHVLGLKSNQVVWRAQWEPKQSVMFKGNLGIPKEDLKQCRNWVWVPSFEIISLQTDCHAAETPTQQIN